MENPTSVGKEALHYRLVTNEFVGIIICLAITAIAEIFFLIFKIRYAVLYDTLVFAATFILQFIVIYFISLLQYKNLKYAISQNAVSFQRGAFSTETETIPFEKIKSSVFDQTFIQKLFSIGDITIDQEDEKYSWEDIDSKTATLISNAVSVKGDVQPITVATANVIAAAPQNPV